MLEDVYTNFDLSIFLEKNADDHTSEDVNSCTIVCYCSTAATAPLIATTQVTLQLPISNTGDCKRFSAKVSCKFQVVKTLDFVACVYVCIDKYAFQAPRWTK